MTQDHDLGTIQIQVHACVYICIYVQVTDSPHITSAELCVHGDQMHATL